MIDTNDSCALKAIKISAFRLLDVSVPKPQITATGYCRYANFRVESTGGTRDSTYQWFREPIAQRPVRRHCCYERMEKDYAANSQTSLQASLRWFATKPYERVHLAPKSQGPMITATLRISCLHSPCAPNPIFGRMRRRRTAQHSHSSPEDSTPHDATRVESGWCMLGTWNLPGVRHNTHGGVI